MAPEQSKGTTKDLRVITFVVPEGLKSNLILTLVEIWLFLISNVL